MADTKLSVNEIMLLIVGNPVWCNIRTDIVVPNLSWGLLNHEADLAIIRKSGYLTEIEIKRSYQDLKTIGLLFLLLKMASKSKNR